MTRPARPVRTLGVVALVALSAGGCVPSPATTQAQSMAGLWQVFLWAGAAVAALVWILATWALLRYRRRPDPLPKQDRGNLPIEIAWTAAPLITVLVLFVLTLQSLAAVDGTDAAAGSGAPGSAAAESGAAASDAIRLDVTAYRWGWTFTFPDAGVTVSSEPGSVPQIDLPVGTTVHVTLASLDVDHAFYVPAFLFKRDAIPGRLTTFDLRVVAPGVYGGLCAEYCGVFHDAMPFEIQGVSMGDYQAWLASRRAGSAAP